MKLPTIPYKIFDVKILSKDEPIKIRPFTVREQQMMLMAVEAGELPTTVDTLKQIISNCVITELDIDNLPLIDMEIIFHNLRARSIGEVANVFFKCKNDVLIPGENGLMATTKECGMIMEIPVNMLEIPIINKDIPKKIMFNDELGVMMKYPTFSLMNALATAKDTDAEFVVASNCLDQVFDKKSVYNAKDCKPEELIEFITALPTSAYEKIKHFIDNTPKAKLVAKKTCPKCKFEHEITLEGIEDFFV